MESSPSGRVTLEAPFGRMLWTSCQALTRRLPSGAQADQSPSYVLGTWVTAPVAGSYSCGPSKRILPSVPGQGPASAEATGAVARLPAASATAVASTRGTAAREELQE